MADEHPQIDDLDAVMGRARGLIRQGIAVEQQLPEGERGQGRAIVANALHEMIVGINDWFAQYLAAGPLLGRVSEVL